MSNLLDKINTLDDFKSLNKNDLPKLACDIREFLIDNISKTGGCVDEIRRKENVLNTNILFTS